MYVIVGLVFLVVVGLLCFMFGRMTQTKVVQVASTTSLAPRPPAPVIQQEGLLPVKTSHGGLEKIIRSNLTQIQNSLGSIVNTAT